MQKHLRIRTNRSRSLSDLLHHEHKSQLSDLISAPLPRNAKQRSTSKLKFPEEKKSKFRQCPRVSAVMKQPLSSAFSAPRLPSSSPVGLLSQSGIPILQRQDLISPRLDSLAGMGAAYGTAKSGVGVASMGVMRPELVMKSIVPVVMAGVLGIYGLIIAVIISTGINPRAKSYYLFDGYAHLSSGLACGLAGLSAGMAIGIVGDAGVRANAQQPKLFVGMILILIFAEALALYGLIVGIILSSRAGQSRAD
ncbi:hypothetical protein ACLOJK_033162 [Asimina triloba]